MKIFLGAILLLLVGCSGVVQAQGEDKDAQIAALTERVVELEYQVEDLRAWLAEFQLEFPIILLGDITKSECSSHTLFVPCWGE